MSQAPREWTVSVLLLAALLRSADQAAAMRFAACGPDGPVQLDGHMALRASRRSRSNHPQEGIALEQARSADLGAHMSRNARLLALAGAALLLTRSGRSRARGLPAAAQAAVRRRRTGLPRGVEEYPSTLVDRRHGDGAAAAAAADMALAGDPVHLTAKSHEEQRRS